MLIADYYIPILHFGFICPNFFPLKVGNTYQIKNFWSYWGPGGTGQTGTNYYAITVVADSVIKGDIFFRFSNSVIFNTGYLFSYDALNQKVFVKLPNDSTLRLGIDFNSPSGSNYISYLRGSPKEFTSGGITSEIVLGDTHNVYSMQHSGSDLYIYKFADNLCISYFHARSGTVQAGSQTTQNVISAIIDSLIYNPIVLGIDTVYPIQDRPVDTFPFLLRIPYTASYTALVDSFYLTIHQLRADTLVQSKRFNISKSNPKISLYLAGLLPGDKLKRRATITDTSIYYNTDVYPDTG